MRFADNNNKDFIVQKEYTYFSIKKVSWKFFDSHKFSTT